MKYIILSIFTFFTLSVSAQANKCLVDEIIKLIKQSENNKNNPSQREFKTLFPYDSKDLSKAQTFLNIENKQYVITDYDPKTGRVTLKKTDIIYYKDKDIDDSDFFTFNDDEGFIDFSTLSVGEEIIKNGKVQTVLSINEKGSGKLLISSSETRVLQWGEFNSIFLGAKQVISKLDATEVNLGKGSKLLINLGLKKHFLLRPTSKNNIKLISRKTVSSSLDSFGLISLDNIKKFRGYKSHEEIYFKPTKQKDIVVTAQNGERFVFRHEKNHLGTDLYKLRSNQFQEVFKVNINGHNLEVKIPRSWADIRQESEQKFQLALIFISKTPKSLLPLIESINFPTDVTSSLKSSTLGFVSDNYPNHLFMVNALSNKTESLQTYWHEMGHLFAKDFWNKYEPDQTWSVALSKDKTSPSAYSQKNLSEDFAETFALYLNTDGGLSDPKTREAYLNRFRVIDRILNISQIEAHIGGQISQQMINTSNASQFIVNTSLKIFNDANPKQKLFLASSIPVSYLVFYPPDFTMDKNSEKKIINPRRQNRIKQQNATKEDSNDETEQKSNNRLRRRN